ncbi:MAG: arginine--tRNA ligase [Eubacteriales bacterium]|nr:arginine--tRNA ligase [Oscillospiraceae bacterium]MDY3924856.1 arginine--tRNA ligase [Eubacteriales bacterium]
MMLQIKQLLAGEILGGVKTVSPEGAAALTETDILNLLEYPPDPAMGDIALPCFKLSRILRRSPVQIANALAPCIGGDCVERAEAVNGYLNIYLSGAYLLSRLVPRILEEKENYGAPDIGQGRVVVLDYSSPNVAKPFHIGHLGTTVIGHSLKKLHEFAGYNCIGINYLGDWGTQFGKLILAYRMWGSREAVETGGIDELVSLYVRINNAISGNEAEGIAPDPVLAEKARAEFHKMEMGDPDNIALWKWFVQISLEEYQKTYRQLDITFDSYKGESFYTDKMPAQVQKLRDKGLLKLDDGASIVDLSAYDMPPCLILKRDGSTLYPTRDIAAAVYRKQEYHFDKCIYVTSAQQILHFRQWFKVVELMGYDWYDELVHVPYGTVSVNGAKLATRTGNVVLLRDLFGAAIEKVTEIMETKNPALKGRTDVAEAVGVGAIVFYYLSNNRIKDINFSMEEALSFDGNTGPYVQYTYARACSILEKAGVTDGTPAPAELTLTDPLEKVLCVTLSEFEERVRMALRDYEPSYITRYILDVATAFNRFYHDCAIVTAEDAAVRETRLALTRATKYVLGRAFGLICLRKTEKI